MKFGCCFSLEDDRIFSLKEKGADYVEVNFSALADKTPKEIAQRGKGLEEIGLPCYAMNCMFPGHLPLVGEEVSIQRIRGYLEETFEKAALLGPKRLVFGSGKAREIPTGFSEERAFDQLTVLCAQLIAPLAQQYGLVCAIEPLNRGETNCISTCGEGFRLVQAVNSPAIRLLVDLYHFDLEQEPLSSLAHYQGTLAHAHIASAKNNRAIPQPGDGEDYQAFFQALSQAAYDQALSLEGNFPSLDAVASSFAYLRKVAQEI